MSEPTEEEIAKVSRYPRVTKEFIERSIVEVQYFHPAEPLPDPNGYPKDHPFWTMTVCTILLDNGYVVMGTSAPVNAGNFDEEIGRRIAYQKAFDQLWPLYGFALKQTMYEDGEAAP